MFQSVIEEQGWRSGRFGAGMGVSTLVHAALLASALVFSTQQGPEVKEPEIDLTQRMYAPQPPRGSPAPAVATQPKTQKPRPKPKDFVQPREVKPVIAEPVNQEPPPAEEPPDEEPVEGVVGGHPEGVLTGGVLGAVFTGLPAGGGGGSTGEDVLPFGSGMTRPELLSGGTLQYTREALEAHVEGTLIAKCVITREGEVEDCRILRGLPHMDAAVLSSLTSRRYRPVTFQGRPVTVSYTFNVRLEMP